MDLDKLQVLLQVIDCGSIQGAARQNGLTRALVRRRLDVLEAEVGTQLLHRDTTGVHLTSAGKILAERGRALLRERQSLLDEVRGVAGEGTGVIHVVEPVGLPVAVRAYGLLATHRAYPKLRHVVRQVEDPLGYEDEPCDMVLHVGPAPAEGTWFSRVLIRASTAILASPDYLRERGTPQSLADLQAHDTLGWILPHQEAKLWPLLVGGHVEVSPWYTSPDLMLLRKLAADGGGLLFAPYAGFPDDPGVGPLLPVLTETFGGTVTLRASTRHSTRADARTRDTLTIIQEVLASLPVE